MGEPNTAWKLYAALSPKKMWTWWSVNVLAAPEAARTLQADLSVMVLEDDEKEKERQGETRR